MTEQELKKKLAEWAGFTCMYKGIAVEETGVEYWACPPNKEKTIPLPNFTQSLDAIFKWLVPKYVSEVCQLSMGLKSIMEIYAFLFAEWLKVMQDKVEPALALCLVIEKLIDAAKTK